ncbi:hypothetical protein [Nocardia brasiliensis]|uniref:hypothetical protein n=1 Tax=Nocardia brasiliensis TaxID=37326 RepID=UPI003D8D9F12
MGKHSIPEGHHDNSELDSEPAQPEKSPDEVRAMLDEHLQSARSRAEQYQASIGQDDQFMDNRFDFHEEMRRLAKQSPDLLQIAIDGLSRSGEWIDRVAAGSMLPDLFPHNPEEALKLMHRLASDDDSDVSMHVAEAINEAVSDERINSSDASRIIWSLFLALHDRTSTLEHQTKELAQVKRERGQTLGHAATESQFDVRISKNKGSVHIKDGGTIHIQEGVVHIQDGK